ncbi:hypothetical protein ACS0TY_020178 [Phlomoides rotata]
MEPAARRSGGLWEGMYRMVMRRTSVYVTFVLIGAFVGERAVDRGVHALWDRANVGVLPLLVLLNLSKIQLICTFICSCFFLADFYGYSVMVSHLI